MCIKFEGFQPVLNKRKLLSPLSVDLKQGEFVVMSAPSGAGKTRMLETLFNRKLSHAGRVDMCEQMVSVPQGLNLCEQLSAWENVACSRLAKYPWWKTLFGLSKEESIRAKASLEYFGFHAFDTPVSLLSGGERQRVALARLINSERKLWILDEPVSNLDDFSARYCLEQLLKASKKRGATVLCVLHRESMASVVADRCLKWGKNDWKVS